MLADRPPVTGNQTGMDGFGYGSLGNQTDIALPGGLRGAVFQLRGPVNSGYDPASGNDPIAAEAPKDAMVNFTSTQAGATAGADAPSGKDTGGHADGHVFLLLVGLGVVALVLWAR